MYLCYFALYSLAFVRLNWDKAWAIYNYNWLFLIEIEIRLFGNL